MYFNQFMLLDKELEKYFIDYFSIIFIPPIGQPVKYRLGITEKYVILIYKKCLIFSFKLKGIFYI